MKPVIYFRDSKETEEEFAIASKYFLTVPTRTMIPKDSLVIPRYSALPFYKELQYDTINLGSVLINYTSQI